MHTTDPQTVLVITVESGVITSRSVACRIERGRVINGGTSAGAFPSAGVCHLLHIVIVITRILVGAVGYTNDTVARIQPDDTFRSR